MIIVKVAGGKGLDKALKELKRKFVRTQVVKELRERSAYKKPSAKKREMKNKAIYRQKMKDAENI